MQRLFVFLLGAAAVALLLLAAWVGDRATHTLPTRATAPDVSGVIELLPDDVQRTARLLAS